MESLPRTMEDNLAPDHQQATNTNFLEERTQILEQAKHDVSMSLPPLIEQQMPEEHWMARNQLMKPVLVRQVDWTTSQERNFELVKFNLPAILGEVESVVLRTLSMYAFYKLTPVVRLQINATQFHQGQLIMSFDPFNQAVDRNVATNYAQYYPIHDIYYASGLPNVKVMASEADPVELHIPFVHPRSFLTSNSQYGYDDLGRVRVTVLNPLLAAEGASPSVAVTIWIYAKDASVHVPMNYHTPQLPIQTIPSIGEVSNILDNIAGGARNTYKLIGNLITGNPGKALRDGQGLVDNLGEIFGFDYPTRTLSPEKTISPVENMAISVGASRSQRLCLDPVSSYTPDPAIFGSTSDDLDLMRIAKTPMLLAQVKWLASSPVGTNLFTIPITPMIAPNNLGTTELPVNNVSFLAFATSLFNYWRGGITFDIEFIATHFHSGRLAVGFSPNADPTSNNYANVTSSLPNIILDLQQTSRLSFSVPFVSATPLKYVELGYGDTPLPLTDESLIGYLGIYVMNKLVAASNVAPSVEINVYIRASDDYQLFTPAHHGLSFVRAEAPTSIVESQPSIGGTDIQSNRIKDTGMSPVSHLTLGSGLSPKELRFGESFSLVDLIRRFNFAGKIQIPVNTSESPFSPVNQEFGTSAIIVSPTMEIDLSQAAPRIIASYYTTLGVLSRIFSVWSGSIRHKDVTNQNRMSEVGLSVVHYPTYYLKTASDPRYLTAPNYAQTITTLAQDNTLEYEIPYYAPYQCLMTKPPPVTDIEPVSSTELLKASVNGVLVVTPFGSQEGSIVVYRFQAGGDDFRFAYLRPPGADYFYNPDSCHRTVTHSYTL